MMKHKNWVFAFFSIAITLISFGQEQESRVTYKLALSFSPGLLSDNTQTANLHGYFGMRPAGKIELRGDGFYFLNSTGDRPRFSMNHQLYAGAFYRFSKKKFQPYTGFQPGIAYAQSSEYGTINSSTGDLNYKKSINPVASVIGGFDLFGEKFFYLFLETRYILGKHKSDTYPVFLDEWRFSFGLGFYIN